MVQSLLGLKFVNRTKCSPLYKKNHNFSLPKHIFFFNSCCEEKSFQYFINVYSAMLEGHTQYILVGWSPSILDTVIILVRKFGSFESTYFSPTHFDTIGICKHEKAALATNIGFDIIVAKINWSYINQSGESMKIRNHEVCG